MKKETEKQQARTFLEALLAEGRIPFHSNGFVGRLVSTRGKSAKRAAPERGPQPPY